MYPNGTILRSNDDTATVTVVGKNGGGDIIVQGVNSGAMAILDVDYIDRNYTLIKYNR
jgi:hypothetical protein